MAVPSYVKSLNKFSLLSVIFVLWRVKTYSKYVYFIKVSMELSMLTFIANLE